MHPRPPGFRLGTAAAAYQVEGATLEDGRGPCVWDVFQRHEPAGIAAGSYHRLDDDLALLDQLGVPSHQFGISWSRVLPYGRGRINQHGLDYYDRMVDGLLAAGIEPTATLYSSDLPHLLEREGGWLSRSTAEAMGEYAAVVAQRLGDRVAHWVPMQRPIATATYGYGIGTWAPGLQLGVAAAPATHHLLLGHGRAVDALRAAGARSVGCENEHAPIWSASDDPADIGVAKLVDAIWNRVMLEGMLLGRYPEDLADLLEYAVEPGDLASIRAPLDFYGINYAAPIRVAAAAVDAPHPAEVVPIVGHPVTDDGSPAVPSALQNWLISASMRYGAALPPLRVMCRAPAFDDPIDDGPRIGYLASHLRAVKGAAQAGAYIREFSVSSLLDGWDWNDGHHLRHGFVHVNRDTLERTPKASFYWYAEQIAAQSAAA